MKERPPHISHPHRNRASAAASGDLADRLSEGYDHIACPGCGARDARLFALWPRAEGVLHWRRVQCTRCGLVYSDPVATEETIRRFYERHFAGDHSYYFRQEERTCFRKMFRRQLDMLDRLGATGRLLEIGCSGGYFLEMARGRRWRVCGVEASPELADCARKRGLDVHTGAFPGVRLPESDFDVIRMSNVLEHIRDIKGALREARRFLKGGGLVAISEPNLNFIYGIASRTAFRLLGKVPRLPSNHIHTVDFTRSTLGRIVADCGFEVHAVDFYNPAGDDETYREHTVLKLMACVLSSTFLPRMRRFFDLYATKI